MTCNCSLRSRIVNFNGSHGRSAPLERFGPKWRIRALEQDGSRGSSLLVRHLSWIVPLLLLGTVWAQEPSQPQIAQAQERLKSLGFEVGDTAGVLDPRTAKALEAFQRTRRLAVTGELDTATLRALGVVPGMAGTRENSISRDEAPSSPWRPVLEYLRFFDSQPARLLLHVTPGFRGDLTATAWVAKVMTDPAARSRHRVAWQIEKVDTRHSTATVHVRSRVRIDGVQRSQLEAFSLVRSPDAQWLIDAWHATDAGE